MRNSIGKPAGLNRVGVVMKGSGVFAETVEIDEMEAQAGELGIPSLLVKALLAQRKMQRGAGTASRGEERITYAGKFSENEFADHCGEDLPRLRRCYDFFRADIPDDTERWRWALAAYKGGIQPVENALKRAKRELAGFKAWRNWNVSRIFLEDCDIMQMSIYVSCVWTDYLAALQKSGPHFAEPRIELRYGRGEMAEIEKGSRA